jgi:hypothetical protein
MDYEKIKIEDVSTYKGVTDITWSCYKVGFGHLAIDADTHDILDDECMSKDFCNAVIKEAFKEEN